MLGSLTAVCLQARITGVRARRRTPWSVLEDISHTHTHKHACALPAPNARCKSSGLRQNVHFKSSQVIVKGFGENGYHKGTQTQSLENTTPRLSNPCGAVQDTPLLARAGELRTPPGWMGDCHFSNALNTPMHLPVFPLWLQLRC